MFEKQLVGLDIGSTGVRAARVTGLDEEGFAIIDRLAVIPMRSDAFVSGKVRNKLIVTEAVKKALKSVGARSGYGVVGVSSPEQGVSRVALPAAVKPQERTSAIKSMGVTVAPTVPIAEGVLSANFVREEQTADGKKVAALIVGAAMQSDVESLSKICKAAGYEPRAVDLSGVATLRALVRDLPTSRDAAIIVDVGATTTTIVLRDGLYLRSIRSFPGGGLDITRAISAAAREPLEDSEKRKYAMRLSTNSLQNQTGYGLALDEEEDLKRLSSESSVEHAMTLAAGTLIDQIAQAVEADAGSVATRYVALCGGGAQLRGFKERLQRRLGVEVRLGQPWAHLARTKSNLDYFHNGREDPRLMLSLTTATGLALWRDIP